MIFTFCEREGDLYFRKQLLGTTLYACMPNWCRAGALVTGGVNGTRGAFRKPWRATPAEVLLVLRPSLHLTQISLNIYPYHTTSHIDICIYKTNQTLGIT